MLDTRQLLADTLRSTDSPPVVHKRTAAIRPEANESLDSGQKVTCVLSIESFLNFISCIVNSSLFFNIFVLLCILVSSGGILRNSNEYIRSPSGIGNKPRQYLRFSVPTAEGESSTQTSDVSEIEL